MPGSTSAYFLAHQTWQQTGDDNRFVVKLDNAGTTFNYVTSLPTPYNNDFDVDLLGNVFVTGYTEQNVIKAGVFITKISPIELSNTSLNLNAKVGSQLQQVITLSNNGLNTMNVIGITVSGTNSSNYTASPTTFDIPVGQTQDITLTFAPTSVGPKTATLSIANNISGTPLSVSLSGQGTIPVIATSHTSFTFGNVSVGGSSQQTITVSNTGDDTLDVTDIQPSGTDATLFSISPTSFSTPPGQNQTVTVTFSPTTSGNKTASLSIEHNASGSPTTISLSGQGTAPIISLSSTSLVFGNISVGSSTSQTVTLSNTGDDNLSVTAISLSGTDASLFAISPTSFTVSVGQSQILMITFLPTSSGSKTASLSIEHNATGSPTAISLNGQGLAPTLSLSTTSVAFGNASVGTSSNQTITISNTGNDTLKVTGTTLSDPVFSVTPTTFSVLPNQNQTVTVTATPTVFGALSATLSIAHNASGSPTAVSLIATGTAPDIGLSANALGFGDVETNTDKTLTVVVSNAGNADLVVSQVTSSNSAFTISPTTFTVSADNNQGVGVTFRPTSTGGQSATVTLTSNDPDEASLTVTLTGTGTEPPPPPPPAQVPVITFTSQNITFGNVQAGSQNSQSITISNTGNATLSISEISITGDAFSLSATTGDIEPGQNQEITVTFAPTTANETTGNISITHNAGSATVIPLTGTGVVEPIINVAVTDLDFGQILANTTGTLNLTISNTGNADLQITNLTFTNLRFETAPAILTIAGGDSQLVAITFRPVTDGLNTGILTINHNAQSDPIGISLSGEGTLPLGLQITPDLLDFSRVSINGQSSGTLQLDNPGTDTLKIIILQTHRLEFQVVQGKSVPITLAPSDSQILDILFSPRQSGITADDLTLTTQDSTFTVPIQGEGVVAQPALLPHLEITPSEITFSKLSDVQSDTTSITLSNQQGTGTLFVTQIQSNDALVFVDADSFLIKSGEQRTLQVIAQATERAFPTGRITFSSNDPNTPNTSLTWRAGALLEDLVMVDLDTQTGDQNMHRLLSVLSGDTITVQFFSKNFPPITGYGMFVDYDTNQMTFLNHTFNADVLPGATEQIRATNGRVNFGISSFSGIETSGDTQLGSLTFLTTESLSDSTALTFNTVTLSLSDGGLLELPQRTPVWLIEGISPDFTGDGQVDFRDFLLFGQAFGSSDPNYDLDGDGSVGFPDFIIFALAFGG